MAESSEIGWACLVGTYEIRRASELPTRVRKFERELDMPHLVQVGPANKIFPKREVWDMAILRLLNTKLPKIGFHSRKLSMELQAESIRLGVGRNSDAYWELWQKKMREGDSRTTPDFTDIAKSALEISSHLGMLLDHSGAHSESAPGLVHESIRWWERSTDQIQAMFYGREARRGLPRDLVSRAGGLEIVLFYKPEGVSMRLLPDSTGSALIYHAAQMVTNGTKLLNCEYCNTPFLSGGEARGGGRRRDARFCKDECR